MSRERSLSPTPVDWEQPFLETSDGVVVVTTQDAMDEIQRTERLYEALQNVLASAHILLAWLQQRHQEVRQKIESLDELKNSHKHIFEEFEIAQACPWDFTLPWPPTARRIQSHLENVLSSARLEISLATEKSLAKLAPQLQKYQMSASSCGERHPLPEDFTIPSAFPREAGLVSLMEEEYRLKKTLPYYMPEYDEPPPRTERVEKVSSPRLCGGICGVLPADVEDLLQRKSWAEAVAAFFKGLTQASANEVTLSRVQDLPELNREVLVSTMMVDF